jgi:predicted amidohydrolase
MRIACAQYSPQVGDIDNNLTRADAVLHKAKPEQLEDLDLLVLPELAFTGKSIKSPILLRGDDAGEGWSRRAKPDAFVVRRLTPACPAHVYITFKSSATRQPPC